MSTGPDDVSPLIAAFAAQLIDPSKPLGLLVRFRVRQGVEAEIDAIFAEVRPATALEPGAMHYDLNREAGDPTRIVVYERWASLAALDAHLRTPYIVAMRARLDPLIVGEPEFCVLNPALV